VELFVKSKVVSHRHCNLQHNIKKTGNCGGGSKKKWREVKEGKLFSALPGKASDNRISDWGVEMKTSREESQHENITKYKRGGNLAKVKNAAVVNR